MVLKLVMGFTDTLTENYYQDVVANDTNHIGNFIGDSVETLKIYRNFTALSAEPKVFIEWELDNNIQIVNKIVSIFNNMQPFDISNNFNCINTIKHIKKNTNNPETPIIGVCSLIQPLNPADGNLTFQLLEPSDIADMVTIPPNFGDLEIELSELYGFNSLEPETTLQWAYDNNDTSNLIEFSDIPNIYVIPAFYAAFDRTLNFTGYSKEPTAHYTQWIEDNRSQIESKGYDLRTILHITGNLVIGSLIGDHEVEYQKVITYPYICKIEIVEE